MTATTPDTSASHTPGPWSYDGQQGRVQTHDYRPVAIVYAADSMAQEDANGRLIAAAPELLRCAVMALEELREAERFNPLARVAIRDLQSVIASATTEGTAQ